MRYPEIPHIPNNPDLYKQVRIKQQVTYSTATGTDLNLTLFLPWSLEFPEIKTPARPLIVFVQGSAWTTPDFDYEIPQLAMFAREGYIVATVGHRSIKEGHMFPAFLKDVKCAIRYLRAHADAYAIDPDQVAIWGTSSGGNTALLVGLTGNDEHFRTEEYAKESDAVNAVVSCFGPTDLSMILDHADDNPDIAWLVNGAFGEDKTRWPEIKASVNPVDLVRPDQSYPPFLLLHGTKDELVDYKQMVKMYHKLLDCGVNAQAYQIDGALHERDFWSDRVYKVIGDFIRRYV